MPSWQGGGGEGVCLRQKLSVILGRILLLWFVSLGIQNQESFQINTMDFKFFSESNCWHHTNRQLIANLETLLTHSTHQDSRPYQDL